MADTNIFIGYDLGRGLAPTSATLPTDLAEPVRLAQFMDDVDCTLIVDGAGNYDWVKTGTCLREMAEKSMLVLPDVADPIARVGITLRLWAGCLWAAKPLDRPELSSEFRAQLFTRDIDPRAANDPLFRAGVGPRRRSTRSRHEAVRNRRVLMASPRIPRCAAIFEAPIR